MASIHSRTIALGGLAVLLVLAALLVIAAPEEQSLGAGIKVVYVHVALTWTGMFGLTVMGLLGLGVLLSGHETLQRWAQTLGWVALAFFAAGFAMSAWAARINWGAMFWDEPRTQLAANVIALTVIVQIARTWSLPVRLGGLLGMVPAGFMIYSVLTTELVLHPQSPILTSDSRGIQFAFFGLFALFTLAAGLVVWQLRKGRGDEHLPA